MATYDVYLEINDGGKCYGHVPALPGCFVRAAGREAALAALPQIIRADILRLLRRGLIDKVPDGIELNIVETHDNTGVDADESATFLGVDKELLSKNDLEWYLKNAAENRVELLALVSHLSQDILTWEMSGEAGSIARILSHIGGTELWSISHLVPPGTIPPLWLEKEPVQVLDFLALSRETAVTALNQLSESERSAVHYPPDNPDEQWTVRRVVRRMLEHEREHIAEIQEILNAWRQLFMVRLTAERAAMIWSLTSFSEEMLSESAVFDGYSVKDLLAHVAAWDEFFTDRIEMALGGRAADIFGVEEDEHNLALYEERRDWSFEQALSASMTARRRFEATIVPLSDPDFHYPHQLNLGSERSVRSWSEWRYRHDGTHTADIEGWREKNKAARSAGPKAVVLAAMESARQEMLATIALIPEAERESRLVCGMWTLKDVLGHVADWEWYGVERWRPEQSNRSLQVPYPGTIQEWNDLHAAARKDDSWERVWVDFVNARAALQQIVEGLDEEELGRTVPAPWNPNDSNYRWILTWIHHEREHAADLRLVLDLPDFPERLTHV